MAPSLISAELARVVRARANNACEYCRLPQAFQEATFHIDHVQPRKSGGETTLENQALACVTCSLKKAARTHAPEGESKQVVPIFSPRTQAWDEHFRWLKDWRVQGLTSCGRATAEALGMNRPTIISIRSLLGELGRFPFGHPDASAGEGMP
jgi:hypothetical protein